MECSGLAGMSFSLMRRQVAKKTLSELSLYNNQVQSNAKRSVQSYVIICAMGSVPTRKALFYVV